MSERQHQSLPRGTRPSPLSQRLLQPQLQLQPQPKSNPPPPPPSALPVKRGAGKLGKQPWLGLPRGRTRIRINTCRSMLMISKLRAVKLAQPGRPLEESISANQNISILASAIDQTNYRKRSCHR